MKKFSAAKLKKLADKTGISIGGHDGSPYPTLDQLAAFAAEIQTGCAAKCLKIAEKHQQVDGSRAAAKKAGALECHQALTA
ncbi:hypothetical protein ABIC83_002993 [Roseateles asaccharophilus]|uniref:hypothetical protein n=1 Tax=Roseateles asaccharophilus TaxID=582607 RepID=UPI00383411A2